MLSASEELATIWGMLLDPDPQCCTCKRSMTSRFGGVPGIECESCVEDFNRRANRRLFWAII